jgi:hypothetical protein
LLIIFQILETIVHEVGLALRPSTLRFYQMDSLLRVSDRQKVGLIMFQILKGRKQLYFIISAIENKIF